MSQELPTSGDYHRTFWKGAHTPPDPDIFSPRQHTGTLAAHTGPVRSLGQRILLQPKPPRNQALNSRNYRTSASQALHGLWAGCSQPLV